MDDDELGGLIGGESLWVISVLVSNGCGGVGNGNGTEPSRIVCVRVILL